MRRDLLAAAYCKLAYRRGDTDPTTGDPTDEALLGAMLEADAEAASCTVRDFLVALASRGR